MSFHHIGHGLPVKSPEYYGNIDAAADRFRTPLSLKPEPRTPPLNPKKPETLTPKPQGDPEPKRRPGEGINSGDVCRRPGVSVRVFNFGRRFGCRRYVSFLGFRVSGFHLRRFDVCGFRLHLGSRAPRGPIPGRVLRRV